MAVTATQSAEDTAQTTQGAARGARHSYITDPAEMHPPSSQHRRSSSPTRAAESRPHPSRVPMTEATRQSAPGAVRSSTSSPGRAEPATGDDADPVVPLRRTRPQSHSRGAADHSITRVRWSEHRSHAPHHRWPQIAPR